MAYITISNLKSIVIRSDLRPIDSNRGIFHRPIYFFNSLEKKYLIAMQIFLEDPITYVSDIYKPFRSQDTYKYVYEGNNPAYHSDNDCDRLNADYKNYEIPSDIREQGSETVEEFRRWFTTVSHLIEDRPDAFVMRLHVRWGIQTNVKAIQLANSGYIQYKNYSVKELQNQIEERIRAAGRYYYSNTKVLSVLTKYSKLAHLAYKEESLPNNNTGLSDENAKKVLRYFDKNFKKPLKEELVEFYRVKLNPDIVMNGGLLNSLGFHPCKVCST